MNYSKPDTRTKEELLAWAKEMLCTFSLEDTSQMVTYTTKQDDGTYTLTILENETSWRFNLFVPEDKQADKYFCWFACGRGTKQQLETIAFLIRNRISFTCT